MGIFACAPRRRGYIWSANGTGPVALVLARHWYSTTLFFIHPIHPPLCSLVYLSAIYYCDIIVPRDLDPVLTLKTDPGLCTSNEERFY